MFVNRAAHRDSKSDSPVSSAQQGFTIIEVLIVLAIAGLIMVIVFLAVPSLQRNQRNQSRKTDAKAFLGAVDEFEGSNGGKPPANQTDIDTSTSNMKFAYYTAGHVYYNASAPASPAVLSVATTAPAAAVLSTETINVYMGYSCGNGATSPPTAGTYKNVAIEYVVEQASGNGVLQCLSS